MVPRNDRGPRRETSLRRRTGIRPPRRRTLVVCEGPTEYHYFTGLRDSDRHDVHPVQPEKAEHPQRDKVLAHARTARTKAAYSQVWAVFDTDGADVAGLCRAAAEEGIRTAPSTATFEVWLLLHLKEKAQGRTGEALRRELEKAEPRWSKGEGTRFAHFADGLDEACRRAARLPEQGNPGTQVWRLIEELRS